MTKALPKAYLGNRLYVPYDYVRRWHRKQFTYIFTPNENDKEADVSDLTEFEEVKTYREHASDYIGFSRGNLYKINEVFSEEFQIIDQRVLNPHGYPLRFEGQLLPDQMRCWAEWLNYQYGVIEAPARWGKTVLMSWMLCKLKQRTLVLAQEEQLLDQFEEEFRQWTNINELERKYARRLVGRPKRAEHFYPIATFSSWQLYDHNLPVLREQRDSFGAVFVDEAHSASAACYSRVVNTTNPRYRIGVTATPKRKDGRHVVMLDVMGPVVTKGVVEQLPVHVKVIKTGINYPPSSLRGKAFWAQHLRRVMEHERRNELICERVLQDVKIGHSVIVVTDRVMHIYMLYNMLQKMLADDAIKFGSKRINIGLVHGQLDRKQREKIQRRFTSEKNREAGNWYDIPDFNRKKIRLDAKSGEIKIVIANSKIIQLGWNVPAWSSLHSVMPMSNAPNWYQRISRVRTKCSNCPGVEHPDCLKRSICNKLQPVCHIYVDRSKISQGCFATQHEVHEELGFIEEKIHCEAGIRVKRDPSRKGKKTILWTELG